MVFSYYKSWVAKKWGFVPPVAASEKCVTFEGRNNMCSLAFFVHSLAFFGLQIGSRFIWIPCYAHWTQIRLFVHNLPFFAYHYKSLEYLLQYIFLDKNPSFRSVCCILVFVVLPLLKLLRCCIIKYLLSIGVVQLWDKRTLVEKSNHFLWWDFHPNDSQELWMLLFCFLRLLSLIPCSIGWETMNFPSSLFPFNVYLK